MNIHRRFNLDPEEGATVEDVEPFEDDIPELEYLSNHIKDDFERVFGEDEFEGELDFEDKR